MSKKNIDARMSMFGRLAMESGLVTYDDIVACIEAQEKYRSTGMPAPKLGEILVERGIITQEEVDLILKMQSNPAGLIGRQLMEKGLVNRQQLREALDEQAEYLHAGLNPPRIGELLVEKGIIKREDLNSILKKKESSGNLFGEFLVANRLVKKDDIDKCLAQQKQANEQGITPPRLGELLVANGALRKEQMELYSQRHAMGRRKVAPTLATGAIQRTPGRRAVGDYEILETLGQHVDGVTFKAVHNGSGAVVVMHHFNSADTVIAVPVHRGEENVTDVVVDMVDTPFAHKIRSVLSLRGPATQVVLSDDTVSGHRALIADYIDGVTLDRVIADKGKIEWAWAAEILHDLTGDLVEAERLGITHDDIRPGTILVDAAGRAKLAMWAYTRDPIANRDWLAKKHHPISYYVAPDRLENDANAGTDIFALGLTIVHALTGRAVMRGDTAQDAVSNYSSALAMQDLALDMNLPMEFLGILSSMVETNPAHRPATIAQLHADMVNLVQSEGIEVGAASVPLTREMDDEQAEEVVTKYLSSSSTSTEGRKIPFLKLAKLFAGPVVAMAIIMLVVTAVYKTTQSSHGLMVRANWLDQQGDKAGALTLYRMISVIYPKNEPIQQRYYDLAMEVRDHGEAEIALEKLMDLHPEKREQFREQQGDLQVWQKRFASAADVYREVLAEKPNDLSLRGKLASALLWAHNYPEATRAYSDLANREPGDTSVMLGLARSAAGAKDYEEAGRVFRQLFTMNQLPENTLMEYGWILHDQGNTAELREMARETLARNESVEYSRRNLTVLNNWAGEYEKARNLLEGLSGASAESKDFLLFRIDLNNKLGNFDAVLRDYDRLAELDPGNTEYIITIAHLYQGKGEFEKANANFQAALKRDPNNIDIRREIARNYSFMDNLPEAIRWYRDILSRRPNDKDAEDAMVQAMLWNENYEEAQQYVERNYRNNPEDRNTRVNYALVLSRLGREQEIMPLVDDLMSRNQLTEEEKERLALNAMSSNSNQILLRVIGDAAMNNTKTTELRLLLARRLRGQGRHSIALPLYAAVLAATPNPDPALLMEMAETANWAKRPDIATRWLEIARDIVAEREGRSIAYTGRQRYLLTNEDWDTLLDPLRQQPRIHNSISGFQKQFSQSAPVAGREEEAAPGCNKTLSLDFF